MNDVEPKVGQLWAWKFGARDSGWWPLTIVNDELRHSLDVGSIIAINFNDVFTIVSLDDKGPAQFPNTVNNHSIGMWASTPPLVRWHVILVNEKLAWFSHEWLEVSELLCDVK
jgi:hypothetical protein